MTRDSSPSPGLIAREDSVLVIIDVQKKLLPVIAGRESILENVVRLAKFARIIDLPTVLTEQENLGPTVPEAHDELPGLEPIRKITFDCFGHPPFTARLKELGRKTLILAGIEAHICVAQTALSGLGEYTVQVIGDAVGSRSPHNREIALQRLLHSGATVTSTEMAIYELLRRAGTEEFRQVLKLVR